MVSTGKRSDVLDRGVRLLEPVLARMSRRYLADIRAGMRRRGIVRAVARRDTAVIFGWLVDLIALQGISDRNARVFIGRNGNVTWADIETALTNQPACPRLQCYWAFSGCAYRKDARTCGSPDLLAACPVPTHKLRKGSLNEAAYSLSFFFRDVCGGDFVGWIDARLAAADPGPQAMDRGRRMGGVLLEPLCEIRGIGPKVWSMALADLLLGGDPKRQRWIATGASMMAIDSLVHAFLHRTGILRRASAEHFYGPRCYATGGCADVIETLAARVDARRFGADNPAHFPRLVQNAIWRFCAGDGIDLCNGNRIGDRHRCTQTHCPIFRRCDRVPLAKS